jgi:hypothetical protein
MSRTSRAGETLNPTRSPWLQVVDYPTLSASRIPYTTLTASGSTHTKGSWTEVIAATTGEANVIDIFYEGWNVSAAIGSNLLDIGIGAAASEVAIVSNVSLGASEFGGTARFYVTVPKGSRLSLRVQSSTGSNSGSITLVTCLDPSIVTSPTVITIGADTATSRGVDLTAPGSLDTMAAWTQITAATAEPIAALTCSFGWASAPATAAGQYAFMQLGYGASGSEVALPGAWGMATASSAEGFQTTLCGGAGHLAYIAPARLPAGTRLVARYQRSNAGLSVSAVLHAFRGVD